MMILYYELYYKLYKSKMENLYFRQLKKGYFGIFEI